MSFSNDTCNKIIFQKFYQDQSEGLLNYVYYKSGNTGFAEDTVQESFIRLWKNCARVPLEKAKSFLFTTATNLFRDRLKHKKVVLKFRERPVQTQTNQDPEFLMQEKEFKAKLDRVISALPEAQRITFLMNRIDKLKYREIAEILGVSQKTVEKRIHQALLVLRKEIGKI
ncbi:MAG: sigma-70 family RNA polymerase sigma factor [Saprospiraceae bacterium]|nr:sigma-70 family RNA polymerase sigma factor [Saprospiraceae bacterium]